MKKAKRLISIFSAVALLAGIAVQAMPGVVHADTTPGQITNRSLTLEAGGSDGGSLAGGNVSHLFNFTLHDGTDSLGSITFQYCTTAAKVQNGIDCNAPAGISTFGANLNNSTGETGFTTTTKGMDCQDDGTGNSCTTDSVYNTITIGRTSAAPITLTGGNAPVSYEFTGVVNPSTTNQTFFVRITTYSSLDGTGTPLESGTVAASTANPIVVSGTMPESLVFCTGQSISKNTGGVPDCTTATAGNIFFNQLFSPTSTSYATSQMAASTNAGSGYAITVHGPTLTSGSNTITAMNSASVGNLGVSEFGLNLVHDTATDGLNPLLTPLSADITDPSDGVLLNGTPTADYATDGTYKYADADTVANSGYNTGTPIGTNAQIYTATYMVNVPGSQPAGTYTTTLTYICTPTF